MADHGRYPVCALGTKKTLSATVPVTVAGNSFGGEYL
jgi:hypothetical protein